MTSYATPSDVTDRVPEAASLSRRAIELALSDAEGMISLSVYGELATVAHAMLAAHILACRYSSDLGGEQGAPSSLSAGEISASWATAAPSGVEGSPETTQWGRRFVEITRRVAHPWEVG